MVDITTEQNIVGNKLVVKDGRGRPTATDGEPIAASSDETVVRVGALTQGSDKSWSFDVESVAAGEARVVVTGDAMEGEGTFSFSATLDVVVALDPRTADRQDTIEAGAPTDKPV